MGRLVYGVGTNDAGYATQSYDYFGYVNGKQKRKVVWVCPFYRRWASMLQRGYSEDWKLKHPAYEDTTVCKEWHLFSNFKSWMEQQDWEGLQLDKDILVKSNKEYAPIAVYLLVVE